MPGKANGIETRAEATGSPVSHLGDDEQVSSRHYQVNFAKTATKIALDKRKAASQQILKGQVFGVTPFFCSADS